MYVTGVFLSVQFNNFARTTGFYRSCTLLLKPPVPMRSWMLVGSSLTCMKTSNDTLTYFFLSVNFHGEFLVLVRNLQYLAPSRYRHIAIRKIFFAEVKRGEWGKTELNFMRSLLTNRLFA